MTSKQRAYLEGLVMNIDPVFQIDKSNFTPELTRVVNEALEARELVKITVPKNCLNGGGFIVDAPTERTHSQTVQVIGRKVVPRRPAKEEERRRIVLLEK